MYLLEPGEPGGPGLKRIIDEKISESLDLLASTTLPPGEIVHAVRKNFKRIRAALRLIRPGLSEADYQRENCRFRDLGRLLAAQRDAEVLVETLHRVLADGDRLDEEIARICGSLIPGAAEPGNRARSLDDGLAGDLAAGLTTAAAGVRDLELDQPNGAMLMRGLARTARRARRAYRAVLAAPVAADRFHEWRKQVKYLWHQFEILAAAAGSHHTILAEDLEHLSEQLGLAHDAAILHDWLARTVTAPGPSETAAIARRAFRIRRDHEGAALLHGRALFRDRWSGLLDWFPEN